MRSGRSGRTSFRRRRTKRRTGGSPPRCSCLALQDLWEMYATCSAQQRPWPRVFWLCLQWHSAHEQWRCSTDHDCLPIMQADDKEGDGAAVRSTPQVVCYSSAVKVPPQRNLLLAVDQTHECLLLPLMGVHTPFHINTVKGITYSQVRLLPEGHTVL